MEISARNSLVVPCQSPAAVEQLQDADDGTLPITSGHAIDVIGAKAKPGVEALIEPVVRIGIGDIDDLPVFRNRPCNPRSELNPDLRIDFLSRQRGQTEPVR